MTFDKESNLKFLIIRLSSMGDIVLTSKLIRNIKLNYPKSLLYFVCNKEYEDIIKFNPFVDKIKLYDKGNVGQIDKLRNDLIAINPDVVIDLQKNKRSKYLSKGLNNVVEYDKRRIYKLMLVYAKQSDKSKNLPVPELYIDTIKKIIPHFEIDNKGLEFWLKSDAEEQTYLPHLKNYRNKSKLKIAVAPAAHFKTKRWLEEYFIELINSIKEHYKNSEFIILGGVSEFNLCENISKQTDSLNLAGKTSIIESAEFIDDCDLMISNDTGLMHIAAARNVPVAVFFGSTVREFGFVPYNIPHIILEQDLWCRPCSHIGRNICPLGHFNCMKKITPIYAFNKIIDLVNYLYKIE